jgi:hypothetical protein
MIGRSVLYCRYGLFVVSRVAHLDIYFLGTLKINE